MTSILYVIDRKSINELVKNYNYLFIVIGEECFSLEGWMTVSSQYIFNRSILETHGTKITVVTKPSY